MSGTIWGLYGLGFFTGIFVVVFNKDQHGWLWKFSCIFLVGWIPERIYTWGRALFGRKHTMSIMGFLTLTFLLIFFFPVSILVYWMANRGRRTATTGPGTP